MKALRRLMLFVVERSTDILHAIAVAVLVSGTFFEMPHSLIASSFASVAVVCTGWAILAPREVVGDSFPALLSVFAGILFIGSLVSLQHPLVAVVLFAVCLYVVCNLRWPVHYVSRHYV